MATKARQQYFADEASIQKLRREFSIANEVQQKIDSIEPGAQVNKIDTVKVNGTALVPDANKAVNVEVPEVIDNLYTVDSDNALSAKQGKLLYDYIQNIASRGRFLSNWNSATGLPMTNPSENPYPYKSGDYFVVSNVAGLGGTNYRPDGSSYIIGQASTVVETDSVDVSDFYFYDGTNWLLLSNSGRSIAVDSSLSTTSRNPVENRVITNALSGKQNTLTAGANIQINGNTISATDTKYTAGTGISIANGVISNTQTSAERGNITGTLSDQTDLQTVLTSKATDANVVHKSGAETIAGTKTFSTSPVVPSKTTAATNTGTAIATEAQVYKKQDTLVSGTNIKTINSNSLLGSGDIALNDVKVSATAPSSPTEGMVWYDTTNDQLKVYDGANWNVTGKEYNAGEGIEIGTIQDYSAMQGPAPDGFHVPLNTEWQAVYDVWTALGGGSSDGTNFGIALKLPFAGGRDNDDSNVYSQGTNGYYWSSSPYPSYAYSSYTFYFYSSNVYPQSFSYRAYGISVRCFKNKPVIPTSSWTKLYGTSIEAGGIFWSSTDGLISLSSNGTTWITIADKNLGATTVWNSGDTLSEANCGKYYQRGNNYGFPRTGTVTTSSTQVDASTYGPGNYYSSNTFITYSGAWDSTGNGNLWGGVTGVISNAITNTGVLSVNGQTGAVTLSIPTKTSDITNDSGYITSSAIPTDYVKTSGNQTIAGTKTFSTSPVVPSKTTAATNSGTKIATEAQVYKKQDTISDLATIRTGAGKGATAVQPNDNVSSLTNDAGYITKAVNDLTNYYTKSETYTKAEVADYVANFAGFKVVSTLPTTDIKTTIIYLLGPIGSGADKYEEWIYSNNAWVKIGETTVDLTNYFNKTTDDTDDITEGNNKFVTTSEKNTWNAKQNALATQTAYSAKGSATKVPQITTNSLGQVTGITEVTITQPTVNNSTITYTQAGDTITTTTTNQSSASTVALRGDIFVTQTQYNNLPSTKTTDGNTYIIYKT